MQQRQSRLAMIMAVESVTVNEGSSISHGDGMVDETNDGYGSGGQWQLFLASQGPIWDGVCHGLDGTRIRNLE